MLIPLSQPDPTWLVVRTRPKQERLAEETLTARGLDVFLPRILEPRWHRRAPVGPVPLFPGYLFVRHAPGHGLKVIEFCRGVAGAVRFGGSLGAIEDAQIEVLRQGQKERGYVVIAAARRGFERGARAHVTGGPLAGLEGVVERYLPAEDRVRLLLQAVGSVRAVELEARYVRCA